MANGSLHWAHVCACLESCMQAVIASCTVGMRRLSFGVVCAQASDMMSLRPSPARYSDVTTSLMQSQLSVTDATTISNGTELEIVDCPYVPVGNKAAIADASAMATESAGMPECLEPQCTIG